LGLRGGRERCRFEKTFGETWAAKTGIKAKSSSRLVDLTQEMRPLRRAVLALGSASYAMLSPPPGRLSSRARTSLTPHRPRPRAIAGYFVVLLINISLVWLP